MQGVVRRNSSVSLGTTDMLPENMKSEIKIHYEDLTNASFFAKLLAEEKTDELYHLAAQMKDDGTGKFIFHTGL